MGVKSIRLKIDAILNKIFNRSKKLDFVRLLKKIVGSVKNDSFFQRFVPKTCSVKRDSFCQNLLENSFVQLKKTIIFLSSFERFKVDFHLYERKTKSCPFITKKNLAMGFYFFSKWLIMKLLEPNLS